MRRSTVLRLAVFAAAVAAPAVVWAQLPPPAPVPVLPPPLYVRLGGPAGMKVTVYRGGAPPQTFDAPSTLAFRPGYRCRVQLSGMAGHPGLVVSPSFDVFGSLRLAHGVRAADHPASIIFTDEDFATIRAGNVITKTVVLEYPETALPVATSLDRPLEINLLPNTDPMKEAQAHGRALMVLHVGQREMTPQEIGAEYVPGTILLPGERVLPPPRDPPCLPWMCYPLMDPRVGQAPAEDEMCFHDGGDGGLPAGIGPDGKLRGVDPADTIAQYDDSKGARKIAISNKVCFCVPRFLVLRNEMTAVANSVHVGPNDTHLAQAPARTQLDVGTTEHHENISLSGLSSLVRPSGIIYFQQTNVVGRVEGVMLVAQLQYTGDVNGICPPPTLEEVDKPLIIIKWPDKCDPRLGEVVTFFIRYKNQGHKTIHNVIVNDSLTARLEYVPGSAKSDRDALFTLTPNEANSALLRWEMTQPLPPGQSGTVTFQARVR